MISDHRRILATGLGRLRGKLKYRPVVFELMAGEFTLSALQKTVEAIAGIQLQALQKRLQTMDLKLEVSPAALGELAKVGFDPVFGARPLKRAIQQRIENPLSRLLLEGRYPPKSVIPVGVDPVLNPGVFAFGDAVAT